MGLEGLVEYVGSPTIMESISNPTIFFDIQIHR